MVEDKTESKKETKLNFELVEVPTQTAVVVRNNITGEVISDAQALALILNELYIIKKAVA